LPETQHDVRIGIEIDNKRGHIDNGKKRERKKTERVRQNKKARKVKPVVLSEKKTEKKRKIKESLLATGMNRQKRERNNSVALEERKKQYCGHLRLAK
jgi:hypothetical protein